MERNIRYIKNRKVEIKVVVPPYPVGNYMFKFNNRNTTTRGGIYSKLTI